MAVSVSVMPLGTNLRGDFQSPWTRRRRSDAEADAALETFTKTLESLLGFRPGWHEEGPVRSATFFSVDGFSLPFLQARSWSYRLKLPRLCALEMPQVWIPEEFDPAFHFAAPWDPDTKVSVASSIGVQEELETLLKAMAEEDRPDLAETGQVANRLKEIAALSAEHRLPVIVES